MLSEKINPEAVRAIASGVKKDIEVEMAGVKKDIEAEMAGMKKDIEAEMAGVKKNTTHVGQIILSTTLNTADKVKNIYGGNWEAFGAGRVLVGAGGRFTAGQTGGEYEHTLTVNEMPSHSHSSNSLGSQYDGGANFNQTSGTSAAGGGQPHNNMQPYVVVYMWRRIS